MAPRPSSVWVISDGRRGIENQALGLAEALERQQPISLTRKIIGGDPSFVALPPALQYLRKSKPVKFGLAAPFPDIAIGCGRQAIAPMKTIKKSSPDTFMIYIQDPRGHYNLFDLIIAPKHDQLSRPNAISMIGSPNRLSEEKLADAAKTFKSKIDTYSAPRAALLIGGNSKRFFMGAPEMRTHMSKATSLLKSGYSLFITLSRRTENDMREAWTDFAAHNKDRIWFYDETAERCGPNPYFAFLSACEIIFVTQDSTNMLTESYYTGAPVYRLPMRGDAGKFETLYSELEKYRSVPPFENILATPRTSYKPLRETDEIAQKIWDKIKITSKTS